MSWTQYNQSPVVLVSIHDERYDKTDDQRPAEQILLDIDNALWDAVQSVVDRFNRPEAGVEVTQV